MDLHTVLSSDESAAAAAVPLRTSETLRSGRLLCCVHNWADAATPATSARRAARVADWQVGHQRAPPRRCNAGEVGQAPVAGPIAEPAPSGCVLLMNVGTFVSGNDSKRRDWMLSFPTAGDSSASRSLRTQAGFSFFGFSSPRQLSDASNINQNAFRFSFLCRGHVAFSLLLSECLQRLKHL